MPATQRPGLRGRRYLLGLWLPWEGVKYFRWWIAAAVAVTVFGPLVMSRYTSIETSVWSHTASVGEVFTAIVAGTFLFALIPTMLANGLTRRELAVAHLLFGVVFSLALSALIVVGYVAEHLYYDALGWSQGVDRDGEGAVLETWGQVADQALRHPLLILLYFIAGALIGAATYRWPTFGWLVSFPAAAVVFTLDNVVFSTGPWGVGWLRAATSVADDWHTSLALTAVIVAAAIAAAIGHRLLIDIPVRTKGA